MMTTLLRECQKAVEHQGVEVENETHSLQSITCTGEFRIRLLPWKKELTKACALCTLCAPKRRAHLLELQRRSVTRAAGSARGHQDIQGAVHRLISSADPRGYPQSRKLPSVSNVVRSKQRKIQSNDFKKTI